MFQKKRRYRVTATPTELARLRAFDNEAEGRTPWPNGPNIQFLRGRGDTFHVKEWGNSGVGNGATVLTIGTAHLHDDDTIDIVVMTKSHWMGYIFLFGGAICLAVTPREGLWSALLGVGLLISGWFLYLRRPGRDDDLDEVEGVLRAEINGTWEPV